MVNSLATHLPTYASVMRAYEAASGKWRGCNWQTEHGPLKLNLHDVRARQARLMANATSGDESRAWEQATEYLIEIESDANKAEKAAAHAISLVKLEQWNEALIAIEKAVELESKYRQSVTWGPLRDGIAASL